jgi:Asp-tRNA(Asn)/Glu-tRNA(Gln) amidotransferase A subunit family amidase
MWGTVAGVQIRAGAGIETNGAMKRELGQWSLTELRRGLERGEISAAEAVRACLQKIAVENDELRTFVSLAGSAALAAAEAADLGKAKRTDSGAGALWGVPIAIKDLMDVRGMRTMAASRVLEGAAPAEEDAECVRRLRAAGAIIVGKTNLHEFAYGGSGAVSAYGAARNPRDRTRVCGGSSSGSAAAVAAGMCFGALGTDTAGSVRLPAAGCGVVGFKPTWGAIPVAGVIPLAWSYDHVGPLARTVEDAGVLFAVLAAEEPRWGQTGTESRTQFGAQFETESRTQFRTQSGAENVGTRSGIRCGVARKYFCEGLAPEVEAGFERALEAARGLGWSLREVEIEVSEDRRVSNAESWAFHEKWVKERGGLYDPRTLPRIVNGKTVRVEEYVELRRGLELLRERQRAGVEGVDVVLTPTSPILPPALEEMAGPEARGLELKMLRNTRPFNVLGWPAVTLACAAMVGVQVSAGWGQDWLALTAARELERALGRLS